MGLTDLIFGICLGYAIGCKTTDWVYELHEEEEELEKEVWVEEVPERHYRKRRYS